MTEQRACANDTGFPEEIRAIRQDLLATQARTEGDLLSYLATAIAEVRDAKSFVMLVLLASDDADDERASAFAAGCNRALVSIHDAEVHLAWVEKALKGGAQ